MICIKNDNGRVDNQGRIWNSWAYDPSSLANLPESLIFEMAIKRKNLLNLLFADDQEVHR